MLITESTTSGSLSSYLKIYKNPRPSICQTWLEQILTGLRHLHAHGFIHGRLTSDNILMNSNTGEIKIGNLVLSKLQDPASPPLDDIRAFGLIALEIALARLVSCDKLRPITRKLLLDSSPSSRDRLARMVAKVEDRRYRSLIELCLAGESVERLAQHEFFRVPMRESCPESRAKTGPEAVKKIKVVVNILAANCMKTVSFIYDASKDSVEGVIHEMRSLLGLSEKQLETIEARLRDECMISQHNQNSEEAAAAEAENE